MKRAATILILISICTSHAQNIINGIIKDEKGSPIAGANIYLEGTIEGTSSITTGEFTFETQENGLVTLVVSYISFKEFRKISDVRNLKNLNITLKEEEASLDEIFLTASTFSLGKSRTIEKMNALDIVMTGSSNGDIYGAIQSLPGTQKVGEDGKLYVRGGDAEETQMFIDGMHVLVPYTSPAQNTPARSKFSPFLFKGINFSLGGYELEYGQALSSVLPMETKDVSTNTKIGINISPLSIGGGGSYSSEKQSLSGNVEHTKLNFYNSIFPDRYDWKKNYETLSAQTQFKSEIGNSGIFKLFLGFDNTKFIRNITDALNNLPTREFDLNQNNYYINSTFTKLTKSNYNLFFGVAFSQVKNKYKSSSIQNDLYEEDQNELHIKVKMQKSFSSTYKLNSGFESYIETYHNQYTDPSLNVLQNQGLENNIYAGYLDNQFKLTKGLYANASGRLDYTSYNFKLTFSPRLSLNYINNNFQLSGIFGKYYQTPQNYTIVNNSTKLNQESAIHYILGSSYSFKGRLLKLELYYKDYNNLSLMEDSHYTSNGYGESSGLDFYFTDDTSIKNLEYTVSYSYNNSKRLYKNYPEESKPLFATDHNGTLSLKYLIPSLKTYIGLSNTYASGRPYNNPNLIGFINSKTKSFHSLDMNLTFLLNKKLILYTSISNVLGRKNTFGYRYANSPDSNALYENEPIKVSRDRFFYIGLFISLKNNSAYDVSNF